MIPKNTLIPDDLTMLTKSILDIRSNPQPITKGARHTSKEYHALNRMIEIALELGAIHPEMPLTPEGKDEILERLNSAWQAKGGARHSKRDLLLVQELHDLAGEMGAECRTITRGPYTDKADVTIKGQNDAPNYRPADSPKACENCKNFDEYTGNEYCGRYDFVTANNYVCDAWLRDEEPNLIPGYEGKSDNNAYQVKNWENSTVSQRQGRDAVNNAIKAGNLAKAHTKKCFRCRTRQAEEYHHINGYSKDRRLRVRPVCSKCHSVLDPNKKKANFDDLGNTMAEILVLRGGRSSGNWVHSGRPGKRGGSGGGGGFKRIKVKPGSSRKKVKAAAKKAKAAKVSGSKPKAVSKKPSAKAKATAKKPGTKAKVAAKKPAAKPKAAEKKPDTKAKTDKPTTGSKKLDDIFDSAPKGNRSDFGKHLLDKMSTGDISFEDAQKLNVRFAQDDNKTKPAATKKKPIAKPEPKTKPAAKVRGSDDNKEISAAKATLRDATKQRDAELKSVAGLEKQRVSLQAKIKAGQGSVDTLDKIDDVNNKLKGRSSAKIMEKHAKDSKTASDLVFNDNLSKAKTTRENLSKQLQSNTKKQDATQAALDKSRNSIGDRFSAYDKSKSSLGDDHPDTVSLKRRFDNEMDKSKKLGDDMKNLKAESRKKTMDLLSVDNPSSVAMSPSGLKIPSSTKKEWDDAMSDFNRLVSSDVSVPNHTVDFSVSTKERPNAAPPGDRININKNTDAKVIAHEVAHTIEMKNPRVKERATEWRNSRTKGEKAVTMTEATGNLSYRESETTKPDKFFSPYIGKEYKTGITEVISMGMESMFDDPAGFAKEDPDMFDFIYAALRSG